MVAVVLIMAVAVIAAGVQKAVQKASARASAGSVSATNDTPATPATPVTSAAPIPPATSRQPATSEPSAISKPSATPASPVTSATSKPPATPVAPSGSRYTNPRFGFSFNVPAGYRAGTPPTDGDGLIFTSPAKTATVSAYGANNALSRSPAQEMAAVVTTYQSARDTITYRFFKNDVIAVSGTTPHGMVFYQREVIYPAVIYTLLWSYPAAGHTRYDALVTQTVDSFVPGPADGG
jgi:hypothetical protein